jgi:CubicO group peptidase (beta-lactamase class C family)
MMEASNHAIQAASSGINFEAIDQRINSQMAKHGLQGISMAVTQGKEIIYLKGFGTAGSDRLMTTQTPMYIGSQSKSFTALAVAQLESAGLIDINLPVQHYIPFFKIADPAASAAITVNHLLHHTSGMSDAGFTQIIPDDATREEAVRALSSANLTAPVGEKFQYFNLGYDVLALLIETASGQTYEAYIQQHILDPLGMTHTYLEPDAARLAGLSQGYSRFFGFTTPHPQPHRAYELGAGYIISTAEDMARYLIAMTNDASYGSNRLLEPGRVKRMFIPVNGYGWGWFIGNDHIFHGGANETFKTYVDYYPSRKLGIVLLINQGYILDHYISAPQVFSSVESILLGGPSAPNSQGVSVRWLGWGLLIFSIGLATLHTRNIIHLRGWKTRARQMTLARKIWDIAVSFLIPTLILAIVYWQVKGFFGDRMNLTYQLRLIAVTVTDVAILIVLGIVPDYFQGFVKLIWALQMAVMDKREAAKQTNRSTSLIS